MAQSHPFVAMIANVIFDVLFFLVFATVLLHYLVFHGSLVWGLFGVGVIFAAFTLWKSSTASKKDTTAVKWEPGFTKWFIVAKAATSAAGVATMNIFRINGLYSTNTHFVVVGFLNLNILEAAVRDIELGYFANAAAAFGLMATMPYTLSTDAIYRLNEKTSESHCFVFPLTILWVFLYTSWNGCFTYNDNLSWLTRLILLPPIMVALLNSDIELWLGARVLLLLLHLLLRAVQIIWIYTPGRSALTPVAGSICNSVTVCRIWGRLNFLLSLIRI